MNVIVEKKAQGQGSQAPVNVNISNSTGRRGRRRRGRGNAQGQGGQGESIQALKGVIRSVAIQQILREAEERADRAHFRNLVCATFDPQTYVARGYANDTFKSAVCKYTTTVQLNASSTTPNYDWYVAWFPQSITTSSLTGGAAFMAAYAAPQAGGLWPAATSFTPFAYGPFVSNNPCISFRVIGAEIAITPAGSDQMQSGTFQAAYVLTNAGALFAASDSVLLTSDWRMTGSNKFPALMHYVPTRISDTQFTSNVTDQNAGYFHFTGLGAASNLTFTLTWIVEYMPTAVMRPLVEQKLPMVDPDDWVKVNRLLNYHPELIIGTRDKWLTTVGVLEGAEEAEPYHYGSAAPGGGGFGGAPNMQQLMALEEVKQGDQGGGLIGGLKQIAAKATEAYCESNLGGGGIIKDLACGFLGPQGGGMSQTSFEPLGN